MSVALGVDGNCNIHILNQVLNIMELRRISSMFSKQVFIRTQMHGALKCVDNHVRSKLWAVVGWQIK